MTKKVTAPKGQKSVKSTSRMSNLRVRPKTAGAVKGGGGGKWSG